MKPLRYQRCFKDDRVRRYRITKPDGDAAEITVHRGNITAADNFMANTVGKGGHDALSWAISRRYYVQCVEGEEVTANG